MIIINIYCLCDNLFFFSVNLANCVVASHSKVCKEATLKNSYVGFDYTIKEKCIFFFYSIKPLSFNTDKRSYLKQPTPANLENVLLSNGDDDDDDDGLFG